MTTLFDLIEKQQWNDVIEFVEKESYIPEEFALHLACKHQATIDVIETLHRIDTNSIRMVDPSGNLPLHYSCNHSSPTIISRLVELYPYGAHFSNNDEQMLPIHIASNNGAGEDVLKDLLTAYPESIYIKDKSGNSPINYAEMIADPDIRDVAVKTLQYLGPPLCAVSNTVESRYRKQLNNLMKATEITLEKRRETYALSLAHLQDEVNEYHNTINYLKDEIIDKDETIEDLSHQSNASLIKALKELEDEREQNEDLESQLSVEKDKSRKLKKQSAADKEELHKLREKLSSIENNREDEMRNKDQQDHAVTDNAHNNSNTIDELKSKLAKERQQTAVLKKELMKYKNNQMQSSFEIAQMNLIKLANQASGIIPSN